MNGDRAPTPEWNGSALPRHGVRCNAARAAQRTLTAGGLVEEGGAKQMTVGTARRA